MTATRRHRYRHFSRSLLALTMVTLSACGESAPPGGPPPPAEVRVIVATEAPITNELEVPGRLQAVRISEVRAQVDGIVQRRLYAEGTDVAAGQPLFAIDPREFRAQLSSAEAALARAEATEANASQDVKRYEGLVAKLAISQQEYDAAVAQMRTAQADVAQAKAQLATAQLNLGYATVTAPISGRAGRAEVTEGALVSAASATLLTRIEQVDPIYANFSQSSADLLRIRREVASGDLNMPALRRVEVQLILEDGTEYGAPGHLNFQDQSIDEATGTSALRAEFPNKDRALLPGQFVRVRIKAGVRSNGILIPQRAVTVLPQGAMVMVVGAGDSVSARPVTTGAMQGANWVILSGLAAGDRVIVDGLQKAAPGSVVKVVGIDTAGDSTAAPATAADTAAKSPT
jgi:membrane fusion protein (multidrug efflux system)